ncbi:hypothetical protein Nepgr_016397 [Nepenthes gracilis]|uniref:Uncharacterized protein n=1 Tax=Nepenthes gracilis TaxID=150966 RepID=A0AAD3SQF0_NEPGR|nr:hypothetical protein Nepgr_016397 [Nepenthes gracilis]
MEGVTRCWLFPECPSVISLLSSGVPMRHTFAVVRSICGFLEDGLPKHHPFDEARIFQQQQSNRQQQHTPSPNASKRSAAAAQSRNSQQISNHQQEHDAKKPNVNNQHLPAEVEMSYADPGSSAATDSSACNKEKPKTRLEQQYHNSKSPRDAPTAAAVESTASAPLQEAQLQAAKPIAAKSNSNRASEPFRIAANHWARISPNTNTICQ